MRSIEQWRMRVKIWSIVQHIEDKIKEALTNTGAVHPEMNGSLLDGGASFAASIRAFAAAVKRS